jgi:predicted amidohydrolase YtcJ
MTSIGDAEFVFRGVIRPDAYAPASDAVAVRDGVIVALGAGDCAAVTGPSTVVIEVAGVVVPGFVDAHVHPVMGGLELTRCDLSDLHDLDDYRTRIRDRAAAQDGEWVLGAGWYGDVFPGGFPTAALLDELVLDRPAAITSHDAHSVWVNSAALRAAGIGAHTPDPAGGRIARDENGDPTGLLMEGAQELVRSLIPPPADDALRAALLQAQRYLHSLGVVGWQDAAVGAIFGNPDTYPLYRAMDADGSLTAQVTGALWWDFTGDDAQLPTLVERRTESASGERFKGTAAKIMQDGVCENLTAAVLEPYRGHDHEAG